MANKRKYPKVSGYWVYSIQIPSINKYYIGVSKLQCCSRWQKTNYKDIALNPYLEEWDSMVKTVLVDNLTKEEALKYEDNIIRALKMNDLCINKLRSGLITVSDKNAYMKQYQKEYQKEYRENNKEKIQEQRRQRRLKKKLQKQTSLPLT